MILVVAGGWWLVGKECNCARSERCKICDLRRAVRTNCWAYAWHGPCESIKVMSTVCTYRDLEAWQVSMNLVEDCYALTGTFPSAERFGLTGAHQAECNGSSAEAVFSSRSNIRRQYFHFCSSGA